MGGEDPGNVQTCIDILEMKVDTANQCLTKVLKERPPFLDLLEHYEQQVAELLGKYGIVLLQDKVLKYEEVVKQWEEYATKYFSLTIEFDTTIMHMSMHMILKSHQATQLVDNLVDKVEEVKEALRVAKFCIEYIPDPPFTSIECYISNHHSYRKSKKQISS